MCGLRSENLSFPSLRSLYAHVILRPNRKDTYSTSADALRCSSSFIRLRKKRSRASVESRVNDTSADQGAS
jgi:hypothetical protein